MANRNRQDLVPSNQESADLLRTLIEAPPSHADARLAPIVLRSVEVQRDHALRGFLRRTWVDRALWRAERLLVLAAFVVFAAWFIDGPLRDWWYLRAQAAAVSAPPAQRVPEPARPAQAQLPDPAVALPFVTDAMAASLPADEFITPRQALPVAPVAVDPLPTRLQIPALTLDTAVKEVFVVDGVWQVADYAAGYMHGTGLPGERGNTVLSGHAGMRGAVFGGLGRLAPGDDVFLEAGGWRYQYRVRASTAVWPTQIEVLDPTDTPVLTLITCTNWDTQRLVVTADLIGALPVAG